jgi:MarR family transcriptional regulator, organic hydroperoxide resistance regulator
MDEQLGTAITLGGEPVAHAGSTLGGEPVAHAGSTLGAEPVAHAEPFVTGTGQTAGDADLNQQIADSFSELFERAHKLGQGIASDFGMTGSDAKALFMLQAPMTMKELGQRMGVDPSFVTSVADALEKRGLARREPSQRDRRSKNIVLTPEGARLRDLICGELMARAPWCTTLDVSERQCLLGLIRKMLRKHGGR